MNQRLSSLSQTIESLKNEKVRHDQAMREKEERIWELSEKNISKQLMISELSETNDQMKKEIEYMKQQILKRENEARQLDISLSEGIKSSEPLKEFRPENIQSCNRELTVSKEPEGVLCHENLKQPLEKEMQLIFPVLAEDPGDSEAEKRANEEEEEESKGFEEALEVLSNTKKVTSDLIVQKLVLEKENGQLKVDLKKTKEKMMKFEEIAEGFEIEKMRINMQLESAKQENYNLKKIEEDKSKALEKHLEEASKSKKETLDLIERIQMLERGKKELVAKSKKETLESIEQNQILEKEKEELKVNIIKTNEMMARLEENMLKNKKETSELIDRNVILKKEKEDLEVKVEETNERKRKLEENVGVFENEQKRIKLELAAFNDKYEKLEKSMEDHQVLLSAKDLKLKEKDIIIARQKSNIKILLASVDKLKV